MPICLPLSIANKAAKAATNVFPEPTSPEQGASLDNLSLNPVQYPPRLYFGHWLVEKVKMQENVASNRFDNAMATLKLLRTQPHFCIARLCARSSSKISRCCAGCSPFSKTSNEISGGGRCKIE